MHALHAASSSTCTAGTCVLLRCKGLSSQTVTTSSRRTAHADPFRLHHSAEGNTFKSRRLAQSRPQPTGVPKKDAQ
eukprot:3991956-Amphidinium_carterae.1